MARGSQAKEIVIKKIQEAFGADYLGESDKKFYVQALENGEKIQIAISLTCPKTPVTFSTAPVVKNGNMNFEEETTFVAPVANFTEVTISDEERENIAEMMRRLGL